MHNEKKPLKYDGPRLDNGLLYTDFDILQSYKTAKDKRAQMKILAELNVCSIDDIRNALIRAGIDGRSLPRRGKKSGELTDATTEKKTVTINKVTNTVQPEPQPEQIDTAQSETKIVEIQPESSIDVLELAHNAILTYQTMLLKQKKALENEISCLEERVSKFKNILSKCDTELENIDKLLSKKD